MSKSGFTQCEFDGRKAIRYHHEFGDFDFFLVQSEDGTQDIKFIVNISGMPKTTINKIGRMAVTRIRSTAKALHYPLPDEDPTFQDAVNVLEEAESFLRKNMARRG